MVSKQFPGTYAPDGSKYASSTDGVGNLSAFSLTTGTSKQSLGSQAPDGSIYFTLTDGTGNLI